MPIVSLVAAWEKKVVWSMTKPSDTSVSDHGGISNRQFTLLP